MSSSSTPSSSRHSSLFALAPPPTPTSANDACSSSPFDHYSSSSCGSTKEDTPSFCQSILKASDQQQEQPQDSTVLQDDSPHDDASPAQLNKQDISVVNQPPPPSASSSSPLSSSATYHALLPARVCGRQDELAYLHQQCHDILWQQQQQHQAQQQKSSSTRTTTTRAAKLLLVSGISGLGKTQLVTSFLQQLQQQQHQGSKQKRKKITCMRGKFEARQAAEFAPFAAAISMFVQGLMQQKDDDENEQEKRDDDEDGNDSSSDRQPQQQMRQQQLIRERIRSKFEHQGGEYEILVAMIPALQAIFHSRNSSGKNRDAKLPATNNNNNPVSFTGKDDMMKFRYLFCRLLESMCSLEAPVVLFLDDLQWAGAASLELFRAVLTDTTIRGLVVVGACRNNEVALDDDLAILLRQMEDDGELLVSHVALSGLTLDETKEVSSE